MQALTVVDLPSGEMKVRSMLFLSCIPIPIRIRGRGASPADGTAQSYKSHNTHLLCTRCHSLRDRRTESLQSEHIYEVFLNNV